MSFIDNIYKQQFKRNNALILKDNSSISYKNLIHEIENFSANIKDRSLIFLQCQNNFEAIVGYLGSIKSNCVVSLLDENIDIDSFTKLVEEYYPDYIFFDKKNLKGLENFSTIYTFGSYFLLKIKNQKKKILNDQLSLLISTSGSTGSSKLVRQSLSNINNNTESIVNYLKILETDITITTLPMSYVYGLSIINTHLSQGATVVLNNESVTRKEFWNNLQKNKVTNFGGVPYIYSILEKIDFKNFDLKHLKYTTQAGGKIHKHTAQNIIKKFDSINTKLYLMYGAAEATARMSYLPWENIDKIESIGKPIPGGEFELKDLNNKTILDPNIHGNLIYKGKNVCMGYAKNFEDLSKGDENNGRLETGDIAYKDKDNFYYLVGRKDRYIKIYGMRINLQELENIVSNFGFENICIQNKENTIEVYIKGKFDLNKLKINLANKTRIHPSVFVFESVKEFSLNKNLKFSYNQKLAKQ